MRWLVSGTVATWVIPASRRAARIVSASSAVATGVTTQGQGHYTTFAQIADYCELLVRTDPEAPKHRGISWLILPMDSPGIEIRPLRTLLGTTEFSEVFLDEVRVPVANRVPGLGTDRTITRTDGAGARTPLTDSLGSVQTKNQPELVHRT